MTKIRSWEFRIILIILILWLISLSYSFLFPLLLGFFLYLLLNPIFNLLLLFKIPRILAAALIVLTLSLVISLGISSVLTPAYNWVGSASQHFKTLEKKFDLKKSLGKIYKATESVQDIGVSSKQLKVRVVPDSNTLGLVFGITSNVMVTIGTSLVFLFFLLIYFKFFIQNIEKALWNGRRINRENFFLGQLQSQVSRYMFTFTLICAGLGLVVACSLWLIDFPNPFLWGVFAMFLTYIPYLGHLIGILTIFFVSLVTYDTYWQILLPSIFYFVFMTLEGQIITPMLLGTRLNLNPLIVFLNMLFWGWIWGISGIFLSVPLLVVTKIILMYVPSWKKYTLILEK